MNNESKKRFEAAYREAYELAKNGNPVIQTAIARACFENVIPFIGDEEGYRLAREAASKGFPSAILLTGLYEGPLKNMSSERRSWDFIEEAILSGCAEAKYMRAFSRFAGYQLDEQELLDELTDLMDSDTCFLGSALLIVKRFMAELEDANEAALANEAEIDRLKQQISSSTDLNRHQIRKRKSRIRELEGKNKQLSRKLASLSSCSQVRDCETLRAELAGMRQRLTNAECQVTESHCQLDSKITEAVKDMNEQVELAQLERDIATEDRDEALRHAEKAEHMVRHLEQLIRRQGLDPSMAFCDGAMAGSL